MPIREDNEDLNEFLQALNALVTQFATRINAAECVGALHMIADDVSQKIRNFNSGPSPWS